MVDIQERTDERTDEDMEDQIPLAEPVSPWHRVTVAGLATLCVILIAIQLVNTTLIPVVAAATVVLAGLAIALQRGAGIRTLCAAAVAAVALVVANLPAAIEDLRHPETFAGFVLMATAVITGLLVGASGVLAATRRAPRAARPIATAAIGVATACVALAGIASVSTSSDPRVAGDIVIDVRKVTYPDVTITAGENVLFIDNHDLIRHTLLIEGTDIDAEIPGATSRRVIVDLAPGTYRYVCEVLGHEAMQGTITVAG